MHKSSGRKRKKNPRENAGIFSILSFFYALDIFKQSKHKELEDENIYEVLKSVRAQQGGDRFQEEWDRELKKDHPSLSKTVVRVYGRRYLCYGVLYFFVSTTIMVVRPLATGRFIAYFGDHGTPVSHAWCYAGVMVACGFVHGVFRHWYLYTLTQMALMIRTSVGAVMYRKALRLTTSSLAKITSGRIVTMMSKDLFSFDWALLFAHDLWCGFIQLFIMGGIMYSQIGISALVGIGFLIILIPLQAWIGVKTKGLRLKTAAKTDERLRRVQEILTSIKLIKLYNWEKYYTKVVNTLRGEEMTRLRRIFFLKSTVLSISALSYRVSLFLCILTYAVLGNVMTSEKAFVIITCYSSLHVVLLIAIPMSVSQLAEAKSAVKRIKAYLLVPERGPPKTSHIVNVTKVCCSNVTASIGDARVLTGVSLEASGAGLIGVTGGIGSGKTSLLKMIAEDIDVDDGKIVSSGKMSYASQEPWLFPGTIKENVLFGNAYDKVRYKEVLRVCALNKDLRGFPEGDQTIVNDKGLNLSKGQQARINLARAVYKDCDVYLLDDVLSSLDTNVSNQVFWECIKTFLCDRLVFVVCHNEKFLEHTNEVIVMHKGGVKAKGTYAELKRKNISFETYKRVEDTESSTVICKEESYENAEETDFLLSKEKIDAGDDVYGERKEEGKVKFSVYRDYFGFAGGWLVIAMLVFLCVLTTAAAVVFDGYIRKWLKMQQSFDNSTGGFDLDDGNNRSLIITYTVIIGANILLSVLNLFTFFATTTRASKNIHRHVFTRIASATMHFFDTHLSGSILNRFSRDIGIIDEVLGYIYYEWLRVTLGATLVFVVIIYFNPVLIVPASLLFASIWLIKSRFLLASRSLRRLEGVTKAPVIGYLNASLEGLTTIRAAENQDILCAQFNGHQDLNSSACLMVLSSQRAFALWVDFLTNCFNCIVISSFIIYSEYFARQDGGDVGFVVTQMFGLAYMLQWCLRQFAEVENMMTSVERALEYGSAEQEDVRGADPDNWPKEGAIEYRNVTLTYPTGQKQILKGINFSVKPGEKVGIVGRTGAGKSSIISALFRLYKTEGEVLVDGVDIGDIELPIVRLNMSVIPQDPVMFKGTIRTNLDPDDRYTDLQLWKALEDVGLKATVEPLGLASDVDEGGANWSIGQRQLFSLARAVLRNNRIVVLDEATANIDPETDSFVQSAIGRLFADCTILTIAHRVNTVINCEKIMVVDGGVVVEFGRPEVLLADKRGAFYAVAKQAGLVN